MFSIEIHLCSITFPFNGPVDNSPARSSSWPRLPLPFTEVGKFACPFEIWGGRYREWHCPSCSFPIPEEESFDFWIYFYFSPLGSSSVTQYFHPNATKTLHLLPEFQTSTQKESAPRRKLHSARGGLVVVVLRFRNNNSYILDGCIPFHQKMCLFH